MKYKNLLLIIPSLFILTITGCSNTEGSVSVSPQSEIKTTTQQTQISTSETQTKTQQTEISTQEQQNSKVPILMFHYVRKVDKNVDPLGYNLSIETDKFEKILVYLAKNHYSTIHVEDLLQNKPLPAKAIILTFDDGYLDFYTTAYPLLKKYGFTASEAIITGKMDGKEYMTPAQVLELSQNGIEILSHTVHHVDLDKVPNQKKEIEESKMHLEKLLQHKVVGFVYPSGKFNDETLELLKTAGYKIALTTKRGFANLDESLLELHRIRIDNRDSLKEFEKKLEMLKE